MVSLEHLVLLEGLETRDLQDLLELWDPLEDLDCRLVNEQSCIKEKG